MDGSYTLALSPRLCCVSAENRESFILQSQRSSGLILMPSPAFFAASRWQNVTNECDSNGQHQESGHRGLSVNLSKPLTPVFSLIAQG